MAGRAVWAGPGAIHCLDSALYHLPNPLKKLKKNKVIKNIKKIQGPSRPHVCPDWGLRPDAAWRESGGSGEESGSYEGLGLGG